MANAFGNARGNKLWEGNRMILPEHRAYMLEKELHEERFVERPVIDEEKLMEMSRVLSAAMDLRQIVTLTVYDPMGMQSVDMMPTRLERDRLKGYDMGEKLVAVELSEIVDVRT